MALQTRVLERWSDGSVRWVLLDFQTSQSPALALVVSSDPPTPVPVPLTVGHERDALVVSTGPAVFTFAEGTASPFASVAAGGRTLLDAARTRLGVYAADGREAVVRFDRVEVEEEGPLRAAVMLSGVVEGDAALRVSCRVELFAGQTSARVRVVLHNPRRAQHPGGYWELGDGGSVLLRRVALELAPADAAAGSAPFEVFCSPERGAAFERFDAPFRIHQESSGRANWQSPVHVNREGRVPMRYPGYRIEAGALERTAAQATPIVSVGAGAYRLSVTSRLFWEVFPKAYAVGADGVLAIDLLPEIDDLHELQGGERFAHEIALAFGDGGDAMLEVFRTPSTPIVDPEWWAAAGDVPFLDPVRDLDAPCERLVRAAIEGDNTFAHKRDRIDEYGWRHFGDLYADHENGTGGGPLRVSHYNNQYDAIFGALAQLMRSGNPGWWDVARDLAHHVAHVDIYWTDEDKSAYNGGLFWHTSHYVDAGRSTHRSYPRAERVGGGGPSVEHNYSTGLLMHHLMTGDPWSREAVLRLARWTVEMDDGRLTVFRFLSGGRTGLASATASADYHGPGRGAANAIQTLLNAWRLTHAPEWLEKADELIRRCVHPLDDIAARNLPDVERRWSYVVFLQALGRYLMTSVEMSRLDEGFRYARASLLHYARWMAEHEYPYLDKPEILEYPNETWAAQDLRKAEVFDVASRFAADKDERQRFIDRARFFFREATSTLGQWPTKTLTRPVVLLMSYGYSHLWHEAHRDAAPEPSRDAEGSWPAPVGFAPQKAIAMFRARALAGAAALAAVLTALALVL